MAAEVLPPRGRGACNEGVTISWRLHARHANGHVAVVSVFAPSAQPSVSSPLNEDRAAPLDHAHRA